jgi:hypothetical protein
MPFTVLLPTNFSRQFALFLVMSIKGFAAVFAYPCNTVLMTNSATSISVLNTLNGVAVSVSAVGRALGPWMGGTAFSLGVSSGWGILPWWVLAAVAVFGHITTWWLVEGEGIKEEDPSTPISGDESDSDIELLDKHDAKHEELKLLAEDEIDSGTAAQHTAAGHGHGRKGSMQVAQHGEDPELALDDMMEMDDLMDNERARDRTQEKAVQVSGSTLAAPAFKTRLRSPVARKRESLG